MSKDYYKILEVEKTASAEEVKKAFRKKAHEFHPDKPNGNEAKFKEVNEAYQVIGNVDKRTQYDQYGSTFDQQGGFGGGVGWDDFMKYARQGGSGSSSQNVNFDFGDLGDIFGDIFGFGGRSSSRRTNRGNDIEMDFELEFSESIFGVKKGIELYRDNKCSFCNGNLAEPGTPIKTCTTCGGSGQVIRVQRTMLGNFQTSSVCPDCRGEGKIVEKKCSHCAGSGIEKNTSKIEVQVPAGVENGMTLRLSGQGNAAHFGGVPGDLYLHLHIRQDKRYKRDANDLILSQPISMIQASLGDKIDVLTLDGPIELKIPAGTQPNNQFRLRGKGVPRMNGSGRGDLYVEVKIEIPKKLSRRQKKLLEEFAE
ncbi:molecular chaperone DnaJ [Candidatus Falkowbacteria bacterium RIFOXYD2_FULL_35_9]|uniref:Chaperone protein DnaJ n=1 Tax=Candidatus Falkowbacteria bacterium RIFOXYC2_FULL_36_12 TaxID=1798002 RepID=A0A1F5SYM6_9BACT|nr:MAG: molecular chaperone DnaJ [Candidatus Falkowbacteria bacterium RIFOXYB2_FULL_35_7]OGF31759.1 MAG: molecular chaperone DnaJ [Candidatus Falkowbacteria bacterium RIFOXYC2_FULL_36_12]OGF33113.1 MAG: molecular chaperone DnaJ [Candidatus Falkowbacteria bacterium RIFOXYA2_FULL_35_8]OGF48090.1 MAG: molecular chaperone DnaJ [Candidatus Falkowbacteria bacterium RIFOXYD2_FULL_35_9]